MDEVEGGQKTKVPGDHQSRDVPPETAAEGEMHKHACERKLSLMYLICLELSN